ncbi:hypothetical protein L1887_25804 [Cichorium endivia]|nr:hypothetical protein L1887_25804 [Cichorium endivia]
MESSHPTPFPSYLPPLDLHSLRFLLPRRFRKTLRKNSRSIFVSSTSMRFSFQVNRGIDFRFSGSTVAPPPPRPSAEAPAERQRSLILLLSGICVFFIHITAPPLPIPTAHRFPLLL